MSIAKATAIAPSNIAFTKYWGKKDEVLRLPENGSISMCLSNLLTTTTVEFQQGLGQDQVLLNGEIEAGEDSRVIKHLDRVRNLAGIDLKAKVVSSNNFPIGTGLSSSAAGFAALSLAASKAAGLNLSEKDLSILARQGSGSACRSIPSGIVEWLDGDTSETSYAVQIFQPSYWEIADVVAIVSQSKKDVPTSIGQQTAKSSPFMQTRKAHMAEKNRIIKELIKSKDFTSFGQLLESEALELHAIMITQTPPLIYWQPNTILMMKLVQKWRQEGLEVYFTINTGQDVHIIVEQKNVKELTNRLKKMEEVREVIVNTPGEGTRLSDKHLF
ncbi:diphosphomevalonate decarboxylase [Candidatus Daviesbacteria bacterium]|nr:diphosphomevalonate decarboxylase [Candidatus Daviesbacteria bacterium]